MPFHERHVPTFDPLLAFISLLTRQCRNQGCNSIACHGWVCREAGGRGGVSDRLPLDHRIATPRCRRQDRRRNAEERPSVQETTVARPASRRARLIDSADFWRLWFVGLV